NQGGTWLYHLAIGDFTLLVGDSAGPLFEAPAVREALTRFPGCVDVMANAILGFDQPVSGLADPVDYVDAVKPQVFVPTHADAWAPVISAGQEQYRDELTAELSELEHVPAVDFLVDPDDYLAQRAYDVDDPRWDPAVPGTTCAVPAQQPSAGGPSAGPPPAGTTTRSGQLAATGLAAPAAWPAAVLLVVAAVRRIRRA
ncbi:MAG TPA: hypothetical protein VNU26_02330, partial [Mycobacteriales bacterium]|nr:hypothetical protein [Mycobacteriales bacterium]